MKTAVLTGIQQIQIQNQAPRPAIEGPADVLLRMDTVGLCGSDVHYYSTGRIGSQVVDYPFPVGHEGAAIVEAVGPAVTRVRPGDRVAIDPAISCHTCEQCRNGRPHTCTSLRYLGCPKQLDGCLKDYIVMPEECCFPIPESMSMESAALVEPLSIGVYAVQQSGIRPGDTIGILGAGPIGLSVMLAAEAAGAGNRYVTDPLDYRHRLAAKHGAAWTGSPETSDVLAEVKLREPQLLDIVFECCGQQAAIDQGLALLKPGGKLMVIGIPRENRLSFPVDLARHHELGLQNVRRQNGCVQKTIDLIATGKISPEFMITHRYHLDQCPEAFKLVEDYADGVVKAMIKIN
jgi:L-iditol 2-dehydrogenase